MRKHADALKIEEHVRGLLERADQRRRDETEDPKRWDRIIDRLELSLDEAKARVSAYCAGMERQRRRASNAGVELEDVAAEPSGPGEEIALGEDAWAGEGEGEEAEAGHLAHHAHGGDAFKAMTGILYKLARDAREETKALAGIASEVDRGPGGGRTPGEPPEGEGGASHERGRSAGSPVSLSLDERRRKKELRVAVDKIVAQRFDALTLGETELIFRSTSALLARSTSEPRGHRLRLSLAQFFKEVQRRCTEWQAAVTPDDEPSGEADEGPS